MTNDPGKEFRLAVANQRKLWDDWHNAKPSPLMSPKQFEAADAKCAEIYAQILVERDKADKCWRELERVESDTTADRHYIGSDVALGNGE